MQLLVVVGDAMQQLDARERIVGVRDHHLEHVDELLPLAAGLEDRLEHARRQHRLAARRAPGRRARRSVGSCAPSMLERLAVGLDGARRDP